VWYSSLCGGMRVWLLVAFAVYSTKSLAGQLNYCAFEVTVRSSAEAPVRGVGVWLLRADGSVYSRVQADARGVARLCDAPPGLVDIQVGGNLCGAVIVKYLRPLWLETRHLRLHYDGCHEDFEVTSGCYYVVRVLDSGDRAVEGAHLIGAVPGQDPELDATDKFGRLFRFVPWGRSLEGEIAKEGYTTEKVLLNCRSGDDPYPEPAITLRRQR
jgi:hypothetical protein